MTNKQVSLTTIDLYGGATFDYLKPANWKFDPVVVARSLSKICRYTGHSKVFYSVAQHSVLVSRLVNPEHAFAALFHDAAEIFMGDCNSPLKQLLPDYKALEHKIEQAIFPIIGIPYPSAAAIKMVDIALREHEQRDFMYIDTKPLKNFPSGYEVPNPIRALEHEEAFKEFMARYYELVNLRVV